MRYYLRQFQNAKSRAGTWLLLFGRRLLAVVKSRLFLASLLCLASIAIYSRYVTHFNFFLIIEEDAVRIHGTYTRDPELVLLEAGIAIRGDDIILMPAGDISGAAEIQIFRTHDVFVSFRGVTIPVSTHGGTVRDALERSGYQPDPRPNVTDVITPPPETPLASGMRIYIKRYETIDIIEREEIPYDIIEQNDPRKLQGTRTVTTEGANGILERRSESVMLDGETIFRGREIETVLEAPVARVITVGTARPAPPVTRGSGFQGLGAPGIVSSGPGTITLADGRVLRYTQRLEIVATAYSTERWTNKINAIGNIARVGTIAVDPRVIPLRSRVFVTSRDGSWTYGEAIAEDTGGAIRGNIIDLFMNTHDECIRFGRRTGYLYILE